MSLKGKGFFIWQLPHCENGDPTRIATRAAQAGLSHVLIKIADAGYAYNIDKYGNDLIPPVVAALHARNIQVWGWHYVYGYSPVSEANMAISRTLNLNLDGYVIDAEREYKLAGRATAARTFCRMLRSSLGNLPIALSSYRYPSYHMEFPWNTFLEYVDLNMPQVYWERAHNGADQLSRSVYELSKLVSPFRPIFPTGPAYSTSAWRPAASELVLFMQRAMELELNGTNFFSWDWATQSSYLDLWNAVSGYPWPGTGAPDIAERLVSSWNGHDSARVVPYYQENAAHVTSARTVVGATGIGQWYNQLFSSTLPNAVFTITGRSGSGNSRHISWTATSSKGKVLDGNDTLGLRDGKIQYHYTYFNISK